MGQASRRHRALSIMPCTAVSEKIAAERHVWLADADSLALNSSGAKTEHRRLFRPASRGCVDSVPLLILLCCCCHCCWRSVADEQETTRASTPRGVAATRIRAGRMLCDGREAKAEDSVVVRSEPSRAARSVRRGQPTRDRANTEPCALGLVA